MQIIGAYLTIKMCTLRQLITLTKIRLYQSRKVEKKVTLIFINSQVGRDII